MKLGAEKKTEVIALVVLLGVAGALLGRSLLGGAAETAPVAAPLAASAAISGGSAVPGSWAMVDPRLDLAKLKTLR
ncbi:MAG: hypothetical protein ACRD1F_01310, partial [Terriglobales bacterium]